MPGSGLLDHFHFFFDQLSFIACVQAGGIFKDFPVIIRAYFLYSCSIRFIGLFGLPFLSELLHIIYFCHALSFFAGLRHHCISGSPVDLLPLFERRRFIAVGPPARDIVRRSIIIFVRLREPVPTVD